MVRVHIPGFGCNFADRSLYREVLRKYLNPAFFFVFNVTFISLAQSILLFLITTPTYVMVLVARFGKAMSTTDVVFARALMGLVLVEVFADQQQWSKFLLRANISYC
jgi:steroid 5-alpha reductase family enzyme